MAGQELPSGRQVVVEQTAKAKAMLHRQEGLNIRVLRPWSRLLESVDHVFLNYAAKLVGQHLFF